MVNAKEIRMLEIHIIACWYGKYHSRGIGDNSTRLISFIKQVDGASGREYGPRRAGSITDAIAGVGILIRCVRYRRIYKRL